MGSESLRNSFDFSKFGAYVVNLATRKDRLETALPQLEKLGLKYKIERAVEAKDLLENNPFISQAAEACFKSHFNSLKGIADGEDDYCFILEDDFLITNFKKLQKQMSKIDIRDYDLIQIGWLQNTIRDRILISLTTLEGRIFHLLYLFCRRIPALNEKIGLRLRVARNSIVWDKELVQDDFKSGGHFYLVSKIFAAQLVEFNPQPQVPIDNFYATLAATRKFRISRTTKSYVKQSKSPSSIKFAE